MQANLANTYQALERPEEAMRLQRDVYSGRSRLYGEQHLETLRAAYNHALSLKDLSRIKEAKSLLRKTMPVARRVLGDSNEITLLIRRNYSLLLCDDDGATLDDLCEAVTTLEDAERTARRVLGSAHPLTKIIERNLRIVQDLVNRQGLSKK